MADMELDVAAVADAVEMATAVGTTTDSSNAGAGAPPPPLPQGWLMKQSRNNPMYYYYYEMETGYTTWDPPITSTGTPTAMTTAEEVQDVLASLPASALNPQNQQVTDEEINPQSINNNSNPGAVPGDQKEEEKDHTSSSDRKEGSSSSSSNKRRKTKKAPEEVRVLHILKKHKGSRRPSSWRQKVIKITREEAHEELKSLLEMLEDDADDPEALRATFEEIARTESDCSSAKRGGDLGHFVRGKMQKPFEDASFSLEKGELTRDIVDTSSGSHIILRID